MEWLDESILLEYTIIEESNLEVELWIEQYAKRFREIWNQWFRDKDNIKHILYN